ncbi:hypothetical protein ACLKA6_017753 [Drosophila palustris]
MGKITELIESQKKLGSELEQLYVVAAAEASSMDSAQLQIRKEKLSDIANAFNDNVTKLLSLVDIREAKSLPYFNEKYGDQYLDSTPAECWAFTQNMFRCFLLQFTEPAGFSFREVQFLEVISQAAVSCKITYCVVGIRIAANDPAEIFPLTVLHEGTNLSGWSVIGVSREVSRGNHCLLLAACCGHLCPNCHQVFSCEL